MTGHLNWAWKRLVSLGPGTRPVILLALGHWRLVRRGCLGGQRCKRSLRLDRLHLRKIASQGLTALFKSLLVSRRGRQVEKRPKYCTLRLGGSEFPSRGSRMRAQRTPLARSLASRQLYLSAFSPRLRFIPTLTVQATIVVNLPLRVASFSF